MTTLEMIDNALRYGVYNKSQLIDCKAEIERLGHSLAGAIVEVERREKEQAELEKQNTLLKSALKRITQVPTYGVPIGPEHKMKDIANEALNEH